MMILRWYLTSYKICIVVLSAISYCFIACSNAQTKEYGETGYDLDKPYKTINLPDVLKEISGLSYLKDDQLICLNDENSDTYIIDIQTGKTIHKLKIGINGDFEGIEYVESNIFLLKSNGTIYQYQLDSSANIEPLKFPTELNEKNDAEGLAFDETSNSLLIACKNSPSIKGNVNDYSNCRSIYLFDLKTKRLNQTPFIIIKLDDLKSKFGYENFMPSAIAENPVNGNFYILSSVGNRLLVLNRQGIIMATKKLKHSIFNQPEGICFDEKGEYLFISNEGGKNNANILVFKTILNKN